MLGGMWGFYNSRDRKTAKKIFNHILNKFLWIKYNQDGKHQRGFDQFFLKDFVFPLIKSNSMIHDSYTCQNLQGIGFPSKRIGNCYVGSVDFNCNKTGFYYVCPIACRPYDHLDWTYC